MAQTSRKRIEATCKKLDLTIVSLEYDPAIQYDSGGWNLEVKNPDDPAELLSYGEHEAGSLIDTLEDSWGPALV